MIKLFSALYLGTSLDWVARRNLSHDTCTVVQVISNLQLGISFYKVTEILRERKRKRGREGRREGEMYGRSVLHVMYVYISIINPRARIRSGGL